MADIVEQDQQMFKCEDMISISGNPQRANEDLCGFIGNTAWMIDGATGVTDRIFVAGPGGTDAAWLVGRIHALFMSHASRQQDSLNDILQTVLDIARAEFAALTNARGLEFYEYPCASLQICRMAGNTLQVASLGDCTTILWDGHDTKTHGGDPGHHAVDENSIAVYRDLRAWPGCLTHQ